MQGQLFDDLPAPCPLHTPRPMQAIGPGALLLPGFITDHTASILATLDDLSLKAPFRHMTTPGGHAMSVGMTNCGPLGWITDAHGYRYSRTDPLSAAPWPPLPPDLANLAHAAAAAAGYPDFRPDACLINRYAAGSRMGLHQDRDEADLSAPIVSFSLGRSATFLWGGARRQDPVQRILLQHGDAIVWGGASRLYFHGIAPLGKRLVPGEPELRYNLTFRRVTPAGPHAAPQAAARAERVDTVKSDF